MAEVKDYSAEALMRKEKESVELDTDGVNEESVEIKSSVDKDKLRKAVIEGKY